MGVFDRFRRPTSSDRLRPEAMQKLEQDVRAFADRQTRERNERVEAAKKADREFEAAVKKTLKLLEITPATVEYGGPSGNKMAMVKLADGAMFTIDDRSSVAPGVNRAGISVFGKEVGEVSWHINYASGPEYELDSSASEIRLKLAAALQPQVERSDLESHDRGRSLVDRALAQLEITPASIDYDADIARVTLEDGGTISFQFDPEIERLTVHAGGRIVGLVDGWEHTDEIRLTPDADLMREGVFKHVEAGSHELSADAGYEHPSL